MQIVSKLAIRLAIAAAALATLALGAAKLLRSTDEPPRAASIEPAPWRTASPELPPWFGEAGASARIAGRVFGASGPTRVRLVLDLPEPSPWTGREIEARSDGSFDFGSMRRGRYRLYARSAGDLLQSRGTALDTLREAGDRTELYVYPCRSQRGALGTSLALHGVHLTGVAANNVPLRVGGRVVGTTADDGTFDVCVSAETSPVVDEPGFRRFVADGWFVSDGSSEMGDGRGRALLTREVSWSGTVLRADGTPAAYVGVQPSWQLLDSSHGDCVDSAVVTTDIHGRFTAGDRPDETYPTASLCRLRVHMGVRTHEVMLDRRLQPDALAVVLPPPGDELPEQLESARYPIDDPAGAWIRGRVLDHGIPVADAAVWSIVPLIYGAAFDVARTRSDGTFALFLSSRELGPTTVLTAGHGFRRLAGRAVVAVGKGETRDNITINVGTGLVVRGQVVDERQRPVAGVRVVWDPIHFSSATPTRSDGRFEAILRHQGRYRLRVMPSRYREYRPPSNRLAAAIDVMVPYGERDGVTVMVVPTESLLVEHHTRNGAIDLGVRLDGGFVTAVGDEAGAAGLQIGDKIVETSPSADGSLTRAFDVPFGDSLTWTVERAGKRLQMSARAPSLGARH